MSQHVFPVLPLVSFHQPSSLPSNVPEDQLEILNQLQLKSLCISTLVNTLKIIQAPLNQLEMLQHTNYLANPFGNTHSTHIINGIPGDDSQSSLSISSSSNSPNSLQRNKEVKSIFEKAKDLFTLKPKLGLSLLISAGFIEDTPQSIAQYLLHANNLDKSKIGEYLGDFRNIPILHAYINIFNFVGEDIDIALRKLLANFRLPGEAAQIDRIVEKFSSNYFNDNKGTTPLNSPGRFRSVFRCY